jgi:histidyl-tRNA synthetase
MSYRAPRGTFDLLPGEIEKWQWIERKIREVAHTFQYHEVRTPYFEETHLFERGVGETTDIVEKEMYSFADRGDRKLTLRPEGTAGVVRAFVEHKVYTEAQPTKWYYIGPMFRYERPQAGRNRQFHQFGVEAFGSSDAAMDCEVISLGYTCFESLGLQNVRVLINSVGSLESRAQYREELIQYFRRFEKDLPEEAKSRLTKNPMRILDSKNPKIQDIVKEAPSILDFLSPQDKQHFEEVLHYLDLLQIPYQVDTKLVRGLDYYQQTAFEYVVDMPGSQASTIGGGGRYHRLVSDLGGPQTPAIGFGIGLERVLLALTHQELAMPKQPQLDCFLVLIGEKVKDRAVILRQELRHAGLRADMDYLGKKTKGQMKMADRLQSRYVLIFGDQELEENTVQIKNLKTGQQEAITMNHVVSFIKGASD